MAVRSRRRVRALSDLPQRTLALRAAPRGRRSRLPRDVRRPYARSEDAAVKGEDMSRKRWPLSALALVALIGAGCGGNGSDGSNTTAVNQGKAVKFAECMREHGVTKFPDPDASGRLTIDGVLNGSSIDPNGP